MDINEIRALLTLVGFFAFCGIAVWAYSRRARKGFEEAERLPFEDDSSRRDNR